MSFLSTIVASSRSLSATAAFFPWFLAIARHVTFLAAVKASTPAWCTALLPTVSAHMTFLAAAKAPSSTSPSSAAALLRTLAREVSFLASVEASACPGFGFLLSSCPSLTAPGIIVSCHLISEKKRGTRGKVLKNLIILTKM